jgi:sec-independent protein translocase protein TatA
MQQVECSYLAFTHAGLISCYHRFGDFYSHQVVPEVSMLGTPELVIILVIIVVLFGVGRIGKIGGELGKGIRSFREGLSGKEEDKPDKDNHPE